MDGVPQTVGLLDCLRHFLDFRCQVVSRRAQFHLDRAQARLHLVEGFLGAMGQLDGVVQVREEGEAAGSALGEREGGRAG